MCADVFRRHWKIYAGVTVFVGIFSAIYEHYARGVRSKPMIFAFLYPLVLGMLPVLLLSLLWTMRKVEYGSAVRIGANMYYSGVAALTMGSLATGVVEIYGTTNRLLKYYQIFGWPLLGIGAIVLIIGLINGGSREVAAYMPGYDDCDEEDEYV